MGTTSLPEQWHPWGGGGSVTTKKCHNAEETRRSPLYFICAQNMWANILGSRDRISLDMMLKLDFFFLIAKIPKPLWCRSYAYICVLNTSHLLSRVLPSVCRPFQNEMRNTHKKGRGEHGVRLQDNRLGGPGVEPQAPARCLSRAGQRFRRRAGTCHGRCLLLADPTCTCRRSPNYLLV